MANIDEKKHTIIETPVKYGYKVWQPLLLSIMVAVGMLLGYTMGNNSSPMVQSLSDEASGLAIGRVEEVLRIIEARHLNQNNTDSLADLAIAAIIRELDPHSVYLPPSEVDAINESMSGEYKGIGIETLQLDDTVHVIGVLEGSPAMKAGIKQYDQLIAIGDSIVAGKEKAFDHVRSLLRQDSGDPISVTIKRMGSDQFVALKVRPRDIPLNTSKEAFMVEKNIGYIRVDHFANNTYEDFMKSMELLHDSLGMKHLILDLRDNPGGLLPQAVKIINQLINDKDKQIVYTEEKSKKRAEYLTNGKVFFPLEKIVVLINENSASASEIVAAAIQDWDRGAIIGRRSFGKGLVQEQYNLSNGGAVRLTMAQYFTPAGRSIQRDYTDKDAYENDFQYRYDKGFLTNKDTMRTSASTKSLLLQRPLKNGAGISPDIFVAAEHADYDRYEVDGYTLEFTYLRLKNDPVLRKKGQGSVDETTVDAYLKYLMSKGVDTSNVSASLRRVLKEDLRHQFNRLLGSGASAAEATLKADSFVKAGVEFIVSTKKLSDL